MSSAAHEPQRAGAARRPRVLIVDDVEANLISLDAVLDAKQCELVFARSGNEALRQLLKQEFAVMLLDVQMPEMDGYEVAHHARQNPATRDVPIIFLTATHDSEHNVLRGYGTGAVDFLFKPVDPDILRSKVQIFLELYSGRRQLADANASLAQSHADLQRAYAELQATQSQLIQSAKMASLGQLVAGVAHEINNPLAFSIGHLGTARRSIGQVATEILAQLSGAGQQQLQRAETRLTEMALGLERIRELVVKLRTFSRLDEGERKRVSVRECLDSVLTILGHRLGERIVLESEYSTDDQLDCYPSLLNQALMNLVSNAIEAIEGPGKIRIETRRGDQDFAIMISDSGKGIAPEARERLFEPFFTTKAVGEGTGLGLSITYSIVQKHGGSLELDNAVGGGTIARLRLPLAAPRS